MKTRLVLALFAIPLLAGAQMDSGTVDVYFQRQTAEGKLFGCSMVFTSLTNDHMYLRGQQVIVNGSFSVSALRDQSFSFTSKLGTKPFLSAPSVGWAAPNHFYFSTQTKSTAGKSQMLSGSGTTPGYLLAIAPLDKEIMELFHEMAETGKLTVGFNRSPRGSDVHAEIEISTSLVRDDRGQAVKKKNSQTCMDFFDCIAQLAQNAGAK